MQPLTRPPSDYIRGIIAAHTAGHVPTLSRLLAEAEQLAQGHDAEGADFPTFRAFMGRLARAEDPQAIDALLATPGRAILEAMDRAFCQGCHYHQAGHCLQMRDPSNCC